MTSPSEKDSHAFLSDVGYPDEGPNPLVKGDPSPEKDAGTEWRDGRLVDPSVTENLCVHLVGLTPGLWCGACNTHPEHPDLTRPMPPRLPESVRLTAAESEVARRFFAGEATDDELRQVISAHFDRLTAAGVIRPDQDAAAAGVTPGTD